MTFSGKEWGLGEPATEVKRCRVLTTTATHTPQ